MGRDELVGSCVDDIRHVLKGVEVVEVVDKERDVGS
jgi:hypothetical protein